MALAAVLTSWKEIASYLGKGVRTVQRWEREMALPVRRPKPKEKQIVLAFPDELQDWLRQQTTDAKLESRRMMPNGGGPEALRGETLRLHTYAQPLRAINHEGLERMHLLVREMVHQTQLVRERTEGLCKNLQQFRKTDGKNGQTAPRISSIQ